MVRTQNIITIALFSLLLIVCQRFYWREGLSLQRVGMYLVIFLFALTPLAFTNYYLFGHPFVIPQGAAFLQVTQPEIMNVLFSFRNGLFSHHPALLLGGVGFVVFLRYIFLGKERQTFLFFLTLFIAFALQTYINSIVLDWWAGDSFGQRRLISSFPLFAFGMAYLLQWAEATYPKLVTYAVAYLSVLGLYVTVIHVFLWSYDQPHNIAIWMFYTAPKMLLSFYLH